MRRPLRAFPLGAALLSAACSGHGLTLRPSARPADPALLLSCARNVAAERGLGEVTMSAEPMQLQAKSAVDVSAAAERSTTPSYDVLTVQLSHAKQGVKMLVGGASYALRQLRGASIGSSAAKTEWVGTQPSERVALARDAVLSQCGTLGN
jgi:hypothetical protein